MEDQSPGPGRDPASDSPPESAVDPKPATPSHARSPHRWTGSWFDWLFRDRQTGHITIAQFPNIPLWILFATVVLRWVVPGPSTARTALEWTGLAALSWWALDEVLRGVNPWRRLLGLGGCALAVARLASMLR